MTWPFAAVLITLILAIACNLLAIFYTIRHKDSCKAQSYSAEHRTQQSRLSVERAAISYQTAVLTRFNRPDPSPDPATRSVNDLAPPLPLGRTCNADPHWPHLSHRLHPHPLHPCSALC